MNLASYMRMRITSFKSFSDDVLNFWIGEAKCEMGHPGNWCSKDYRLACVYLAAHLYTMDQNENDDNESGLSLKGVTGQVTSVKTLNWSVGFGSQLKGDEKGLDAGTDADYVMTSYGKKYLTIRNRQVVDLTYRFEC